MEGRGAIERVAPHPAFGHLLPPEGAGEGREVTVILI
jgi:hypothetical protein